MYIIEPTKPRGPRSQMWELPWMSKGEKPAYMRNQTRTNHRPTSYYVHNKKGIRNGLENNGSMEIAKAK